MRFLDRMTTPAGILIQARYCGLPGKGHGGYCAGLLAQQIGGAAEVTLRAAPPLERALHVEVQEAGCLRLWDDSTVVAEATAGSPGIVPPPPVSLEEAAIASAAYSGFKHHPFPECFVCGPARQRGDGLRIFPGPIPGRDLIAAPWVPDHSIGDGRGGVLAEVVWAALDCPGGIALNPTGRNPVVLGRLTAELVDPVEAGKRYVVVAWPLGSEGRKRFAGTAIFSEEQKLCAIARATWFPHR